jgi:hypothetical protein
MSQVAMSSYFFALSDGGSVVGLHPDSVPGGPVLIVGDIARPDDLGRQSFRLRRLLLLCAIGRFRLPACPASSSASCAAIWAAR